MSTFRIERIDQGIPDEWIHRINDDGAQIGNDIVAEDVNELSEGVQATQEIILKTSRYLPDTLLDPIEGIASRLKYLEATAGQMSLQDAYINGNVISILSGKPLTLGQRGEVKIDSLGNLSFDPETMKVKGAGASYLNIKENEVSTYLSDMTVGATSADYSLNLISGLNISLKDKFLSSSLNLSESGQSSLATVSQSLVGAINELKNGTFNTTLQSVYDQSPSGRILTSIGVGSIRIENGTGNALLAALQVLGRFYVSDQIEAETLKVGTVFEVTGSEISATVPIESDVEIVTPHLKSLQVLLFTDNIISLPLSEAGHSSLSTNNSSLVGAINELKASIDTVGGITSKFLEEHSGQSGRHEIITTKSSLGTELTKRISVLSPADETVFSVDGQGKLFAKELLLDTLDVKTSLTNSATHINGTGMDHSAVSNHINGTNPHGVVSAISGLTGEVILQQGSGVNLSISGNTIMIAAQSVIKELQDIYDDSSTGNTKLELGKDFTWTNQSNDWLARLDQDNISFYKPILLDGISSEIIASTSLAISSLNNFTLYSNTQNVSIYTQDNTKKVIIQGIDFSDNISNSIDPSLNQTVVGSINNVHNNNIRRFTNTMGHTIEKGEAVTFSPLDTSLSSAIMTTPFFDFHPENQSLRILKQNFAKNIWVATENVLTGTEGVFIRKGNLSMNHPDMVADGLDWDGSEFFISPLSFFYIDIIDWTSISDGETITLGGKVFTAQTQIANVDYSTGNFFVEAPNYETTKNLIKAINYSAYTRDPNDYIGLYAVQDGVAATSRITVTSNLTDGDFITFKAPAGIDDVVLTARENTSLTDAYKKTKVNEFLIGVTKEETAENLAEAINRTSEIFNLTAEMMIDGFKGMHLLNPSSSDSFSNNGHNLLAEKVFGSSIKISASTLSPAAEEWEINPSTGNIDALDPTLGSFRIKVFVEDRSNQNISCSTTSSGIAVTNSLVQDFSDRHYINSGEKYSLLKSKDYYQEAPKVGEILSHSNTIIDCFIDTE